MSPPNNSNKIKLVILDECDAMTKDAQFALRRVIEKYARNARFCLICNYVSKIIPALQSRCTRFRFPPLDPQYVRPRLEHVVAAEGVKLGPGGLDALVTLGSGDMRRSLNILQSCHMAFDQVNEEAVYMTTGNPMPRDIEQLVNWLLNDEFTAVFKNILEYQTSKVRVCVALAASASAAQLVPLPVRPGSAKSAVCHAAPSTHSRCPCRAGMGADAAGWAVGGCLPAGHCAG